MKNFLKKFLTLSMVVATIATCTVGLTACHKNNGGEETAKVNPVEDSSFVNVDINPNIDLVVDKNGLVLSVVANNEDAEDLLLSVNAQTNKTNVEGVKGQSVSVAVNSIVNASVEMGYIDDTNNDVKVLSIKADGSINQDLVNKASAAVNTAIDQAKAAGKLAQDYAIKVVTEVSEALKTRLEGAKEELSKVNAQAAEALTAGKLALMETINELTAGAVEMVDLAKLSVAELNQYIYDLSQDVKVVAKGAVEKIQTEAIAAAQAAEKKLNQIYEDAKPVKNAAEFIAAKAAKNAFVGLQAGYVDFINIANEKSLEAIAAMEVAPTNGRLQTALANDVKDIAKSLYKDAALRQQFIDGAKDATENRYTYKSVAKQTEKALDGLDMTGTTDNAAVAKARYNQITNKINGFVEDNADDMTKAKKALRTAISAAQKGMGLAMKGYVALVAEFNKVIDAPAPEAAPEAFTTYAQLLGYVSNLLTTQNANIEKAFVAWSADYVTPEVKGELDKWQGELAKAKDNAIEVYEEMVQTRAPKAQ